MPTQGANIKFGKPSFMWEVFFRKLGMKPRTLNVINPTRNRNMAIDTGTTFPRQIAICRKVSVTAPTSNSGPDAPSGVGDICLLFKAGNVGIAHIDPANVDIYRCTAYTNTTTFTWAQIV